MKRQRKEQGESQGQCGDFSKQVDADTCNRMKGEHSLQVDHDGDSFHQSQQGEAEGSGGMRASKRSSCQSGTSEHRHSNAEQSASSADFTVRQVGDADSAPGGG